MIEIIFSGRGGQGAVTASQILATAAFAEGMYTQAFPSFGPDRRGAPVTAFTRADSHPIVDRSPITQADYVIVLDPNLFKMSNPLAQLKETGLAVLNVDTQQYERFYAQLVKAAKLFCIDASAISERVYGKMSIPITNVAMLGALVKVSGIVRLDSVLAILDQFFTGEGVERARTTAQAAYENVKEAWI
jgi:2-oxoacid:acceptor oxidoreductase gamma subunit (pyruvate/2-ketoisovalerate family)